MGQRGEREDQGEGEREDQGVGEREDQGVGEREDQGVGQRGGTKGRSDNLRQSWPGDASLVSDTFVSPNCNHYTVLARHCLVKSRTTHVDRFYRT